MASAGLGLLKLRPRKVNYLAMPIFPVGSYEQLQYNVMYMYEQFA
jgi:hypothetical protein